VPLNNANNSNLSIDNLSRSNINNSSYVELNKEKRTKIKLSTNKRDDNNYKIHKSNINDVQDKDYSNNPENRAQSVLIGKKCSPGQPQN